MIQHWLRFEARVMGDAKHEQSISNACSLASLTYLNESPLLSILSILPTLPPFTTALKAPSIMLWDQATVWPLGYSLWSCTLLTASFTPLQSSVQVARSSPGDPCGLLRDECSFAPPSPILLPHLLPLYISPLIPQMLSSRGLITWTRPCMELFAVCL